MNSSDLIQPAADRVPKWSLSMAWWALFSAMFWLYIASASASAVGVRDTLIGMGLSVVVYAVINVAISRFAARTGLSVLLLSRILFGRIGSSLATLLLAATALYYAVFEGSVIAVALESYFGGQMYLWYLIVVAYAVPLAAGGVERWLDRLNGWLLPIYVAGVVAAVLVTVTHRSTRVDWLSNAVAHVPGSLPGWATSFLIYMGPWVLMMYTFDYARLGRVKDRRFHETVTFGWVFFLLTIVVNGAVGIYLVTAWDIAGSEVGVAQAFVEALGFFGVLVVFVSQTRINSANYFVASSNLDSVMRDVFRLHWPRWVWVTVVGVFAYVFMLTDVIASLLKTLAWQGVLITAWVAIALTYMALRRGPAERIDAGGSGFKAGVVVWFVASGLGIAVLEAGSGVWSQLAPVVTVAIASGGYGLTYRLDSRDTRVEIRQAVYVPD
jgi:purine-cytosine permease-like protein